ncbi:MULTISPECIES: DUF2269 family protein [unclassified Mesorhizobium]|uniref:DUF2269 family protein n=1 Tax=unclassified Mesorhizobium TaxID=325217 RepID=UPI0011278D9A|nr:MULTISPECIES: DUF2269 family protein [unclassified Mesorhizobium]MBZ9700203.1 DUF2269 domain-containing protein [Mesorhizobium sp. CO1-1-3]MBZ9949982.1 DUF2269 domain-containing protein [Mesorhizobium sp. BR1-1-11]TPI98824.1 DUF2269 family protein [Mesorhizobium sp. B2-8-1]
MDWYSIAKLLHILSATLWVGGGFALMVLATLADRSGNIQGTLQAMRATGELGNRFFAPMSILTLAFGLIMCWFWVGFSQLWILIGLAGYATTFSIGMFVFKPSADHMGAMIARDGVTPAALASGQRILRAARFDYAVMLVIIADMVLKPTIHDFTVLAAMVLVLAAGATLALGRPRRMVPSVA